MLFRSLIFILLAAFLSAGCALKEPAKDVQQRYFWPIGSPEPRLEFIRLIAIESDLLKKEESRLKVALVGKEQDASLFGRPHAVAVSDRRWLLVTDTGRFSVTLFDLETGRMVRPQDAEGMPYSFEAPVGAAFDGAGHFYVSDASKAVVARFDLQGRFVDSFDLEGGRPVGIAVDQERQLLYVTDVKMHAIRVFRLDGSELNPMGKRGELPGTFNFPTDVDLDREGKLYVADSLNARIQVLSPDGDFIRSFGERGTRSGSFMLAKHLALDDSGHVYVTDSRAHRVVVFDLEGRYLHSLGGKGATSDGISPGGFIMPQGIEVSTEGTIWIADSMNRVLQQFQYLSPGYLERNPILEGELFVPPSRKSPSP